MDKPDVTSKKPHIRWDKKNALVGLIVLVILLGAGLAWYFMMRKDEAPVSKDTPGSIISQALNTRDGVSRLKLEEALKNKPTKEEKIQLYQLLANDAQKRGDFQAAVDYLRQAYDTGLKSANLAQSIGSLYLENLNNKPEALKYFRLGLEQAKTNADGDPFAGDIRTYLEQKIKELEDQGVKAA